MQLNGRQRRDLRNALLSAFPTTSALTELVDFAFDERLSHIVQTRDHQTAAFELIQWAESQGKLEVLVRTAIEENPGNAELAAFVQSHLPRTPAATPPDTGAPTLDQKDLQFLVDTALRFNTSRDLLLYWLPTGMSGTLPVHASPAQQTWSDVQRLYEWSASGGKDAPLAIWIRNLARLMPPVDTQSRVKQLGARFES